MVNENVWAVAIESDLGTTWECVGWGEVWTGTEDEARKRALQRSNDTDIRWTGAKVTARVFIPLNGEISAMERR